MFSCKATEGLEDTLKYIRLCHVKAGLDFNPDISEFMIPKYSDKCDLILAIRANSGFGGSSFLYDALEKVQFTREICVQILICVKE